MRERAKAKARGNLRAVDSDSMLGRGLKGRNGDGGWREGGYNYTVLLNGGKVCVGATRRGANTG